MRQPKWTAYYNDGTSLIETDASNFYDIDKSRLERFALACSLSLVIEMDAINGTFKINNKPYQHAIFNEFAFSEHLQYGDGLVQFKKAHIDINQSAMTASESVVDTVNVGYKVSLNGLLYQVIFTYDYDDDTLVLNVKATDLIKQEVIKDELIPIEGVK